MDFFYNDLPSTSSSTLKEGQEDTQMLKDTDSDLSRKTSSNVWISESEEEQSSSYIDDINKKAQEMVEKINLSRTRDEEMIDSFQEKLIEKVTEMCQLMREQMYKIYEKNSSEFQRKLQSLTEVVDNCSKLNYDLLEASQALACLRSGLDIDQGSE
ncbi:synaptonemal complex central element protein 2 [Cyprinodon tularosa]|uniref:Synaptonemal complex central element protein 2 n=1 Tax=Cyprinodon variegatus TaxID=28743 RepID=A0A3Q2GHJ5_CYPVA|nr:synaptonemal complex central element protein 2 [Cyprinodon tularosa]XP_038163218.1 synaptonemal complex central element protein 2 [Cyprinodon tularosa]